MTVPDGIVLINNLSPKFMLGGIFPRSRPEVLFDHFVQPELLTKWWPPQAFTDPRVGGEYHLVWPEMNWHLRGKYLVVDRPSSLIFSWKWDHTPELSEREVELTITSDGDGSLLQIAQGLYGDGKADQDDKQNHIDGWQHFLAQLQTMITVNQDTENSKKPNL